MDVGDNPFCHTCMFAVTMNPICMLRRRLKCEMFSMNPDYVLASFLDNQPVSVFILYARAGGRDSILLRPGNVEDRGLAGRHTILKHFVAIWICLVTLRSTPCGPSAPLTSTAFLIEGEASLDPGRRESNGERNLFMPRRAMNTDGYACP